MSYPTENGNYGLHGHQDQQQLIPPPQQGAEQQPPPPQQQQQPTHAYRQQQQLPGHQHGGGQENPMLRPPMGHMSTGGQTQMVQQPQAHVVVSETRAGPASSTQLASTHSPFMVVSPSKGQKAAAGQKYNWHTVVDGLSKYKKLVILTGQIFYTVVTSRPGVTRTNYQYAESANAFLIRRCFLLTRLLQTARGSLHRAKKS